MKTRNDVYFLLLLACVFSACNEDDSFLDEDTNFLLEAVFIDNDKRLLNYNAVSNTNGSL